jgi:type VI secretion system protein ImpH
VNATVSGSVTTAQTGLEALFAALEAEPWAHDFFATLRRIETLTPQLPRLGTAARPQQEAVRLGEAPELDFAPAALARFTRHGGWPPRMEVRFFGLLGPQGPMPLHLTEYARERLHNHGDPTLVRFFDVFHHRMLSLLYRAWAQAQPVVQRDRPEDDRFAAWLGSAIGLDAATTGRDSVPDTAKLHQAGLLASRSRHREGLAKILSQFFCVPVRVASHMPQWLALAPEDRTRLGHARHRPERSSAPPAVLGRSATAGSKVWDRQYKFRIELGPLSRAQYEAFLPGGRAWRQLCDWVQLYAGLDLVWDVELVLRKIDVPRPRLGRHVRLGLTTWFDPGPRREPQDRRELHLRPDMTFPHRGHGALHG